MFLDFLFHFNGAVVLTVILTVRIGYSSISLSTVMYEKYGAKALPYLKYALISK